MFCFVWFYIVLSHHVLIGKFMWFDILMNTFWCVKCCSCLLERSECRTALILMNMFRFKNSWNTKPLVGNLHENHGMNFRTQKRKKGMSQFCDAVWCACGHTLRHLAIPNANFHRANNLLFPPKKKKKNLIFWKSLQTYWQAVAKAKVAPHAQVSNISVGSTQGQDSPYGQVAKARACHSQGQRSPPWTCYRPRHAAPIGMLLRPRHTVKAKATSHVQEA